MQITKIESESVPKANEKGAKKLFGSNRKSSSPESDSDDTSNDGGKDTTQVNPLRHSVRISLEYKEIAAQVEAKLKDFGKNAKLPGFRPGKIPLDILKRDYGVSAMHEVSSKVVREKFLNWVMDENIQLAGLLSMEPDVAASAEEANGANGSTEIMQLGQDVSYLVDYEIFPQIDTKIISADVKLELVQSEVSQEDIEDTITQMRKRATKYEDCIIGVEASEQHLATINCSGRTEDGEDLPASDMYIDMEDSYPSAEFVNALKSMKVGDTRNFHAKVPMHDRGQDSGQDQSSSTAGLNPASNKMVEKMVDFTVSLNNLQRKVLPEMNDEFFKQFGTQGGEQAFRDNVKTHMELELSRALDYIKYRSIAQALNEFKDQIAVPSSQIIREAQRMHDDAMNMLARMSNGKSPSPNTGDINIDYFKPRAEEKLRTGLFLSELARQEALSPTDNEVDEKVEQIAMISQDPDKVRREHSEDLQMRERLSDKILEEKAISKFMALTQATPKKVSYKEAISMSAALTRY